MWRPAVLLTMLLVACAGFGSAAACIGLERHDCDRAVATAVDFLDANEIAHEEFPTPRVERLTCEDVPEHVCREPLELIALVTLADTTGKTFPITVVRQRQDAPMRVVAFPAP